MTTEQMTPRACEQTPSLPVWLAPPAPPPAAEPPRPTWFGRLLITAWCGVTVGVVYGGVRHFWPQIDDQLLRLYWSASSLLF